MIDFEHASEQAARGKAVSRATLIGLFAMFATPVIAAWLLFFYGQSMLPSDTTNRGELVQPARLLALDGLSDVQGKPMKKDFLLHKWTLVYVGDSDCDKACLEHLYYARQIRLTQAKNLERVGTAFLIADGRLPGDFDAWKDRFKSMTIALGPADGSLLNEFVVAPRGQTDARGRLYLIDPRGFLMMRYAVDQPPKDIIKDLTHLLRVSSVS